MKFYKWLENYEGPRWVGLGRLHGAVGDLRDDVLVDDDWPKKAESRLECEVALGPSACDGARWALRLAWQMYRIDHPKQKKRKAFSLRERFDVLRADGFKCRLCGASANTGAVLEVDHRVPISKGGSNARSNLWTLCFDCNRGKCASLLK